MRNYKFSFAEMLQRTQSAVLGSDPELKLQWAVHSDKSGSCSVYIEKLPNFKKLCYYRYKDQTTAQTRLREMIDEYRQRAQAHQEYKDKQKLDAAHWLAVNKEKIQIGDIYYSTWGYDQTNVDFYQVTAKKGCFIWLRELAQERTGTHLDQGTAKPIKNRFLPDTEIKKKVSSSEGGYISLNSYSSAFPWDGRPVHYTSYY